MSLKIFGERNCGTTYLEALVARNLDVPMLRGTAPEAWFDTNELTEDSIDLYFTLTGSANLGWKHVMAPDRERLAAHDVQGAVFVTLTKNPYSWLLSFHKRPYHRGGNGTRSLREVYCPTWPAAEQVPFEVFLTSPWQPVGREGVSQDFRDPVDVWNRKNRSYLALRKLAPCLNLKYEDLVQDPESVVENIANTFGLRRRASHFENIDVSLQGAPGQTFASYQDFYLKEAWRDQYTRALIGLVNERLERAVMERFGYDMLEAGHLASS
ncbi:MAG: hypothetical protein HOC72_13370 [Rhodospirillaceae bacterium]|jgi:hypothetical protein|nr:hypothetical protein [Rhodospirillaceae bacterium]